MSYLQESTTLGINSSFAPDQDQNTPTSGQLPPRAPPGSQSMLLTNLPSLELYDVSQDMLDLGTTLATLDARGFAQWLVQTSHSPARSQPVAPSTAVVFRTPLPTPFDGRSTLTGLGKMRCLRCEILGLDVS